MYPMYLLPMYLLPCMYQCIYINTAFLVLKTMICEVRNVSRGRPAVGSILALRIACSLHAVCRVEGGLSPRGYIIMIYVIEYPNSHNV